MYRLHIGNKNYSSWSLRPWVLLTELGIPFEEALHPFPSDRPSYPEFRKFSPTGHVPVLDDGDITVWDSLAIVDHLGERHHTIWPDDRKARAWAHSATAEMHAGFGALRDSCGMNVGIRCKRPLITAALKANIDRLDELWTDGLARFGGPFLAGGNFTAVDAFFCPVAFRAQTYDLPFAPASLDYLKRLLGLSAMQAWYQAGIKETFREPNHEAETTGAHEVTDDLRATSRT